MTNQHFFWNSCVIMCMCRHIYIYMYVCVCVCVCASLKKLRWQFLAICCVISVAYIALQHSVIQGYSKWLSGYNCPAAIPQQIPETTTTRQVHSKVVCTVSRDRMRVYPGTEGTNQNRHWNHHRWHAKRTRLSCWCLSNHKDCTYRAPVRYVTKTWRVVLLNIKKKHIYSYLKCIVYDKLLKLRQSFWITLYFVSICNE